MELNLQYYVTAFGKDEGQKDQMFEEHFNGCTEAHMLVGAYHYSYCSCVENAELEAENCLNYISGKNFDLPVFLDLEENLIAELGKSAVTEIALRFCRRIKQAGYEAGVYANLNWFENYIDPYCLIDEGFKIWLAQWNDEMEATFPVAIWQFTNNIFGLGIDGNKLLNEEIVRPIEENEIPSNLENKSIELLAIEVINGKYGNGQERKDNLGSLYEEVQDKVNDILLNNEIEEIAQNVIKGVYGNGQERKDILGSLYEEVQDRVNVILL